MCKLLKPLLQHTPLTLSPSTCLILCVVNPHFCQNTAKCSTSLSVLSQNHGDIFSSHTCCLCMRAHLLLLLYYIISVWTRLCFIFSSLFVTLQANVVGKSDVYGEMQPDRKAKWKEFRYLQPVPGRSEWDVPAAPLSQPWSSHTAVFPIPSQLWLVAHKLRWKQREERDRVWF